MDAREKMILDNRKLAYSVAKKFVGLGMEIEDLHQEAMIGLIRAVDGFNPEKNYQFSTYATIAICNQLKRSIIENDTIRIPEYLNGKMVALAATVRCIEAEGQPVSPETIADQMKIPLEEAQNLHKMYRLKRSLSANNVTEEGDDMSENIPDDVDVNQMVEDSDRLVQIMNALHTVYDKRTVAIIAYYFGLGYEHDHTLEETGFKFNVTRERVRQIIEKALKGSKNSPHSKVKVNQLKSMLVGL